MSKEAPLTVDYELQIKTLKRSINDLTFTLEEKDREIERLKAKVHSYKLLYKRAETEKSDIRLSITKERNLNSPPRKDIQVKEALSENEKKFLKYKEKFEQLHPFQKEIVLNIFKSKPSREYSIDFKKFCYICYVRSPRSYELFEIIMPILCYKTLYNCFKDDVNSYKDAILNLDSFPSLLTQKEKEIEEKEIPCVLSVDAFTTTIFIKKRNE